MVNSDSYEAIIKPRNTPQLLGAEHAVQVFLNALSKNKLHHAWFLSGPKSCGKATFAYLAAKFLLHYQNLAAAVAQKTDDLSTPTDCDAVIKIIAQSHPDLFVLSRRWDQDKKRITSNIPVDDVRQLINFFHTTSTEGGWRIVIIDKADDMAPSAANALLKILEEPPLQSVFFVISDTPHRLLPTIRSRCQKLLFSELSNTNMMNILKSEIQNFDVQLFNEIATIAGGQVCTALNFFEQNDMELRQNMLQIFKQWPKINLNNMHRLSETLASANNEFYFFEFLDRIKLFIHQHAVERACIHNQTNASKTWIEIWQYIEQQQNKTQVYNLDKKQLILDIFTLLKRLS